jgi:hypothetical protein
MRAQRRVTNAVCNLEPLVTLVVKRMSRRM